MKSLDVFNLKGKVAIITGSSKGIGKAIAFALGDCGAKVVVSSRNQESLDEVVTEFKESGIDALAVVANVGNMEDVDNLVTKTLEHFGGIDIVVNNAATNPIFGALVDADTAAFDQIMNVNVKGIFELAKKAHPSMKQRGGGSVINISSIGGISPEPWLGLYSVSKAALISLTEVMAKEWGKDGIRANVICPGLIKTKFSKALWSNEKIAQSVLKNLALPRIGTPEEIASLALFLASDASAYSTGATFVADGGYTI
jgi:NAD(P)-dependent dehydrogenase (short-subunit alcohol dehydrogenase family)